MEKSQFFKKNLARVMNKLPKVNDHCEGREKERRKWGVCVWREEVLCVSVCVWGGGMCIVKVHVCGGSRVYSNSQILEKISVYKFYKSPSSSSELSISVCSQH